MSWLVHAFFGGSNYSQMANLGPRTYCNTFWMFFGTVQNRPNFDQVLARRPRIDHQSTSKIQQKTWTSLNHIICVNMGNQRFHFLEYWLSKCSHFRVSLFILCICVEFIFLMFPHATPGWSTPRKPWYKSWEKTMARKREVWGCTPGQPWTSEPQKSLRTRRPSSELPPGQVRTSEHARVRKGRQDLLRGQVWTAERPELFSWRTSTPDAGILKSAFPTGDALTLHNHFNCFRDLEDRLDLNLSTVRTISV